MTDDFNRCHVCERPKWYCSVECDGRMERNAPADEPRDVVRIKDKETSFPVYVDRAD